MNTMAVTVHPSAIVDDGAVLGDGCRVWHFAHISAGDAHVEETLNTGVFAVELQHAAGADADGLGRFGYILCK